MLRLLKALIVLLVGLQALFYALQNIANLHGAMFAIGYVISGVDHQHYPNTLFFHSGNPTLAIAALSLVVVGELAVGFFGLKGAWDMLAARNASPEQFRNSMRAGQVAAALALLTWFGLFMTFGGAFFQMWQTEIGNGSLDEAFKFATVSVLAILFVYNTPDGQSSPVRLGNS
jgi:predicted small integral membrane protein